MTIQELYSKFSQGVNWNAFLYFVYKTLFVSLTFVLYRRLSSEIFSTYSNINSLIFLLLLWLDCGFQKAIPRFCPVYAQNQADLKAFIKSILRFKVLLLLVALPGYIVISYYFAAKLHLENYVTFFYAGITVFLVEGIVSLLKLIYHAYFWQKQFNLLSTATLLIEMSINYLLIFTIADQKHLLLGLIINKAGAGLLLATISVCMLKKLYQSVSMENGKALDIKQINRRFMIHSSIMWFNNGIKSLTERNFLVPLFTHIFGPAVANMFKVANDGALLFYRIVLKTIGTTDTALFSHVLTMGESKSTWQVAFKKLTTKIVTLVIPLSGILWMLYQNKYIMSCDNYVFRAFFIITISYLLEAIFSPYERVLEVNRRYLALAFAYTPYIIMVITLLTTNCMSSIGLLHSVVVIHGVRLVSSIIMLIITRVRYKLLFPIRFTFVLTLLTYLGIYILNLTINFIRFAFVV